VRVIVRVLLLIGAALAAVFAVRRRRAATAAAEAGTGALDSPAGGVGPEESRGLVEAVLGQPAEDDYRVYLRTTEVLSDIRKRKTERQLSPGAPLGRVEIFNNEDLQQRLGQAVRDLQSASRADALLFTAAGSYNVELVPVEPRQ